MAGFLRDYPAVPEMKNLEAYAIVYLLDGEGFYKDKSGLELPVKPGDLILVFPGLAHSYGPLPGGNPWTYIYLVFDGPVFRLWQAQGLISPEQPLLHAEPVHHWLEKLESILEAPRKTGFAPPLLEICRLQQFLAEVVLGRGSHPMEGEEAGMISRACALLESDLDRDLDLAGMARSLGCSYESFRKTFARVVGMPPARYRSARLVDKACELMQRGRLKNKQIARELGFSDEYHFSRRFKQIMGLSPRQFRGRIPLLP